MEVSGRASIGDVMKPATMLRAIHWPSPLAYGLQIVTAYLENERMTRLKSLGAEIYSDANHGDDIRWTLSVLQCKGLPEEQTPAEEEEHVARAGIDIAN